MAVAESNYVKPLSVAVVVAGLVIAAVDIMLNPDPVRVFQTNVLPEKPATIQDLKFHKDWRGMHGPVVFAFTASPQDVRSIIRYNKLIKYKRIPEFASVLLAHVDGLDIPWWRGMDELRRMEFYAREERPGEHKATTEIIFLGSGHKVYYLYGRT